MWADRESAQGCVPFYFFRKIACSVTFITIQFGRVFKYRFNSRWLRFWAETDGWTKANLKLLRYNCLIFFCTTSENNKSIRQQDFQRCTKAGISTGTTWLVLPKSLWKMLPHRVHHCCFLPQHFICATRWLHFSANVIIFIRIWEKLLPEFYTWS